MIRAEVTIFGNKSDPVHYLENRAKDIVSILWKNNVDVTRVIFQEETREGENSCYIRSLYGEKREFTALKENIGNLLMESEFITNYKEVKMEKINKKF